MKKSELRNIIKEEIKRLNEGADWILLRSVGKTMDSYSLDFMVPNHELWGGTTSFGTKQWMDIYKRLAPKDKQTVDAVAKENGIKIK